MNNVQDTLTGYGNTDSKTDRLKRCSRKSNNSKRKKKSAVDTAAASSSNGGSKSSTSSKVFNKQKKYQRRTKKVAPASSDLSISSTGSAHSGTSQSSTISTISTRSPPRKSTKYETGNTNSKHPTSNNSIHNAKKTTTMRTKNSQYVALDCEMVGVGIDGQKSALARVTVIDWDGIILMDEYVKPNSEVTDYRTFVSGITKEQLAQNAKMDLLQCRRIVLDILQNKILIGHALENDLRALGILLPWYQIRDTAKYEPFMKVRFDDGVLWPRKLKDLSRERLCREIQVSAKPHSPYEDALAALDLYKSVQGAWEKVVAYKKVMAHEIEHQRQQQRQLMHKQASRLQPSYNIPTSPSSGKYNNAPYYNKIQPNYGVPKSQGPISTNAHGSKLYFHSVQPTYVNIISNSY